MKKFFTAILLTVIILNSCSAQFSKIGGGITYSSGYKFHQESWQGNKSGPYAVSLKGIYEISASFHLSPSFAYFFPHITKDEVSKQTVSTLMFDLDGHYVFNPLHKIELYGLAGIDILASGNKYDSPGYPASKESEYIPGINLGIGTCIKLTEKFDICVEAKYLYNNKYNQLVAGAGILLNFNRMKKQEEETSPDSSLPADK